MTLRLLLACSMVAACGTGGASPATGWEGGADSGEDAGADAAVGADDGSAGEGGGDDSTLADDVTVADVAPEIAYLETGPAGDASALAKCSGPLADAGFTSLADLPLARLCTSGYGPVWEGSPPCQGSILVAASTNGPGLDEWLFDAATGALEASGTGDDGTSWCAAGATGFSFPYQCFYNGGWPNKVDLCSDAGYPDAGGD